MLDLSHIHGPGDAIFAVSMLLLCLLCGAYPVIKMIGWWIEGGIEPFMAIMSLFLYMVLLISATMLPPAIGIVAVLLILASALAMPILGQVRDESQLRKMADEDMARYAAVLQENPLNHAARKGLAEVLHKRGEVDLAIQHMEWILQQAPTLAMRIRPEVESWKRQQQRHGAPGLLVCHLCHAENAPNAERCVECGAAFGSAASMRERIRREGGPKVVVRGWIVTATSLILVSFVLMTMPSIVAAPIVLGTVIAAAWLFLRWVGGDMGTAGN